MSLSHVAVTGRDRRHLSLLRNKFRFVVAGFRETKRAIVVDAYVPASKVAWLRKQGYGVKILEAVDAPDRARQSEGRSAAAIRVRRGRYGDVIWGGGYLQADEVERAIELGVQNHGKYFERIPLPHLTWEKRRVHAFRIGAGDGKPRPAVCLLAGVHGREWGGPDILVYFAMRLLNAYRDRKSIRLGGRLVSAAEVRAIVETLDIVVVPQVNPDGRRFSMDRHPMWRKNRRPAPRGRSHKSIGVDINQFGSEIGDICEDPFFGYKPVSLNGKSYEIQPEYSNKFHTCAFVP